VGGAEGDGPALGATARFIGEEGYVLRQSAMRNPALAEAASKVPWAEYAFTCH